MCHGDQGSRICLQGVSTGRGCQAQHFLERGGGRVSRGRFVICLICLGSLLLAPEVACAQDEVRNYRKPILRVETGGHHARVRSILWGDEETLLTAGEDKLVNVWDLRAEPRLARSLRPPIWRGLAGSIYAIAASKPDSQGQSYLAVAGYGVENRRGDMTIFRFPGLVTPEARDGRVSTGEVIRRLLPPPDDDPQAVGHVNAVQCLAFSPDGKLLASGGRDGRVILWTLPEFAGRILPGERADLPSHRGDVRALAFSPDGQRLVTVGGEGTIRVWDVARGIQEAIRSGRDPLNTVAISPDGQWVFVGSEGGNLWRFDLRNRLQGNTLKLPTMATQGAVEFVTISTDGTRLAAGIMSDRPAVIDPLALSTDVELRAMPNGDLIRRDRVLGLVRAAAFSPSGNLLAFSGGHAQSVLIQDLRNPDRPRLELKGRGSTPFDLGFTADSQAVGFLRTAAGPANPAEYLGYDFAGQQRRRVTRDQLRRAITSLSGWSLQGNIQTYVLEAVNQDGRRWRFELNRDTERNWWSSTMVPAGPGHPRATVAVGCETGVIFCDLETGARTRFFAGHGSPVVSVVPSPDGRWLASSSQDQTIMIYPLAGCDTRPGLGAAFSQRADRAWQVDQVEPRGFVAAMGLLPGDVITWAGIARGTGHTDYTTPEQIDQFLDRARVAAPGLDVIAVRVRRTLFLPPPIGVLDVPLPQIGTTKRNNPVLTLMMGEDKEWVLWTPQGYYNTSIIGDWRYLGWHINADYRASRSADFVPMGTYAATMQKPAILEQLWRTGDLDTAIRVAGPPAGTPPLDQQARDNQPPKITFGPVAGGIRLPAPGLLWKVGAPDPQIALNITAPESSRLTARRVVIDEQPMELPPLAAPATRHSEVLRLRLTPRREVRLAVEATSENQTSRTETMDLIYVPKEEPPAQKPPQPSAGRLIVLAIGNEQSANTQLLPPVPFADKDAETLAGSLADHLVSRDGAKCRSDEKGDRLVQVGGEASVKSITDALDELNKRVLAKQLHNGDVVAVVISSHVLELPGDSLVTAADSVPGPGPAVQPAILTRDISDLLGRISDYGCRVLLFVDGVHELPGPQLKSSIKAWVRDLRQHRRVITFVASKEGPSDVNQRAQLGLFAQGVVNALQGAGAETYTLEAFRRKLHQVVFELSERLQEADAYFPDDVDPRALFGRP